MSLNESFGFSMEDATFSSWIIWFHVYCQGKSDTQFAILLFICYIKIFSGAGGGLALKIYINFPKCLHFFSLLVCIVNAKW